MFKTKKVFCHLDKLRKRLKEIDGTSFETGYFSDLGTHPSGLTYSGLFAILSFGSLKNNLVPRPVLDRQFSVVNPIKSNKQLKSFLRKYFSNIKSSTPPIKWHTVLETVATTYVIDTRSMFGKPSVHNPSNKQSVQSYKMSKGKVPNSPLVFDGDLRDNLSYKINGQVVVTP